VAISAIVPERQASTSRSTPLAPSAARRRSAGSTGKVHPGGSHPVLSDALFRCCSPIWRPFAKTWEIAWLLLVCQTKRSSTKIRVSPVLAS
jgi:hypothetical protein